MDEYQKLVKKLISFRTVSSDPVCYADCLKTVEFFSEYLKEAGFKTQIFEGYGNPVFFAEYIVDPSLETCLIYGHYDVQPAELSDGWDSDPFEVVEKDKRLYGRGIMDDKGQFFVHMVAIKNLIKEKKLRYNIKFISEGEEEMGSPHIEKFIKDHKEILKCDFILQSDEEQPLNKPIIVLGFRGIANFELTLTTSKNDMHSGSYGGAAPNASHAAAKLISTFHDENNKIAIPDFYLNVDKIGEIDVLPFNFEEFKNNTGAKALNIFSDYDFYTHTGLLPALEVVGLESGYIGNGIKTVLPSSAKIKINVRIVKNQTPKEIKNILEKHLKEVLPTFVDYKLDLVEEAFAAKVDINNKYIKKAIKILEDMYHEKVLKKYTGGTEPVIAYFEEILNKPQLLIPFANDDGHMHGINENFNIENIKKEFEFATYFFGE